MMHSDQLQIEKKCHGEICRRLTFLFFGLQYLEESYVITRKILTSTVKREQGKCKEYLAM